ncbi:hypothetical protein AAC387_Pa04g1245 [Persea americana]
MEVSHSQRAKAKPWLLEQARYLMNKGAYRSFIARANHLGARTAEQLAPGAQTEALSLERTPSGARVGEATDFRQAGRSSTTRANLWGTQACKLWRVSITREYYPSGSLKALELLMCIRCLKYPYSSGVPS